MRYDRIAMKNYRRNLRLLVEADSIDEKGGERGREEKLTGAAERGQIVQESPERQEKVRLGRVGLHRLTSWGRRVESCGVPETEQ